METVAEQLPSPLVFAEALGDIEADAQLGSLIDSAGALAPCTLKGVTLQAMLFTAEPNTRLWALAVKVVPALKEEPLMETLLLTVPLELPPLLAPPPPHPAVSIAATTPSEVKRVLKCIDAPVEKSW